MTPLTAEAVGALFRKCLFKDGEDTSGAVIAEGITRKFGLNPKRVSENREEIRNLLSQLPAEFQAKTGGGWTFLNACNNRDGHLWTGLHTTMEELFCLGIADGSAKWLMPRDLWDVLPGGMPYVVVDTEAA